jgi:hypothetical protein
VDDQTSKVDAIPAPVSFHQQWVRLVNHCWATQEYTVVKQWVLLLESIVKQQWDCKVQALLEDMEMQHWFGIILLQDNDPLIISITVFSSTALYRS